MMHDGFDHLDQTCPFCGYPEHSTVVATIQVAVDFVGGHPLTREATIPNRVCGRCDQNWIDDAAQTILERIYKEYNDAP